MLRKNEQVVISIDISMNGKTNTIDFSLEQLRNWINSQKITSGQETVVLNFTFEGKQYSREFTINDEFEQIKLAVKFGELNSSIIPHNLSSYLVDITQKISQKPISYRAFGREHEIEKAWFYLSQKTRNNVFFVGEHDVGKTAIAKEIAQRIAINDCPKEFYDKRVLMLQPKNLLKIENVYFYAHKVKQLILFLAQNKRNIILFIDKAIYMKTDEYLIYLLYSCLKKYSIPLMVTSSEDNFEDYFYDDQSIAKYINCIYVQEPELNEIEPMVRPRVEALQKQCNINISDKIVKYAIFTSELNNSVSANPGKTINILERAFLTAKRKDKVEVDKQCILSCYDTHIKEYCKIPENEKRSTAYHETGHYMLLVKSKHLKDLKVSCVSTLPMDWWAGVTMSYHDIGEYAVRSRDYFIDYIAMCLAGRIAEKKFTNLNSVGASSDLEYANNIAKAMIMNWGFSEISSSINRCYESADYYLMPESKKKEIDDEIQFLINEGTKRATDILEANSDLLKIIAEKLLVEEILTGEELESICNKYEQNK